MDIRMQYVLSTKLDAYQTPRYYQDTNKKETSILIIKTKKKSTIFDDIIKQHAIVPGPAKYIINPQKVKKKSKPKKIIQKQLQQMKQKNKGTYLDKIVKRSVSLPAVGNYQIQKYNKLGDSQKKTKRKNKKDENIQPSRKSVFDIINRDLLNVCPGSYNIKSTLQQSPRYSILPEPKKQRSLPKIPSPGQYNPIPSSYTTFQKYSSVVSSSDGYKKKANWGKRLEDKLIERSPGPIYNLSTNWGPKQNIKVEFNAYKSLSSAPKLSIYHQ